ncbi:MAG: hypothetical protein HYR85_23210 [Planctomycetes bacterium]|nr:hypothetical protein [Planctomycetota bacterium]MBI3848630.1 hypothetical protein [Planctomycetota bacterium]
MAGSIVDRGRSALRTLWDGPYWWTIPALLLVIAAVAVFVVLASGGDLGDYAIF